MSNEADVTTVERVKRTLTRLDFNDCVLRNLVDGEITLFCPHANRNDQTMIKVAFRLLPDIKSVTFVNHSGRKIRHDAG